MILNRRIHTAGSLLIAAALLIPCSNSSFAQNKSGEPDFTGPWLILQAVPSLSWTDFPAETRFAFEWEITPVIFSFGMNRLDPHWHSFFVTQPERFAGSIEFNLSAQLYPHKVRTVYWGFSGQILAHLPLLERGEHLGLNLGAARYSIDRIASNYVVAGLSTLFGFVHYNIKYSPADKIWIHSVEFRFF